MVFSFLSSFLGADSVHALSVSIFVCVLSMLLECGCLLHCSWLSQIATIILACIALDFVGVEFTMYSFVASVHVLLCTSQVQVTMPEWT